MNGSVELVNPDTGTTFGFTLPLPREIQRQLDAGILRTSGDAEKPAELREFETVPLPRGNASHARWVTYATSQGMDPAEAGSLTRDELRQRFTDPQFDPNAAPDVED